MNDQVKQLSDHAHLQDAADEQERRRHQANVDRCLGDARRDDVAHWSSPWISVRDRLPKDDCSVLAATWRRMDGTQTVEVVSYRSGSGEFSLFATHWMPLPPPPAA